LEEEAGKYGKVQFLLDTGYQNRKPQFVRTFYFKILENEKCVQKSFKISIKFEFHWKIKEVKKEKKITKKILGKGRKV